MRLLASVANRASRSLSKQLSSVVKKTTGIVGLDVVPDARAVLIKLYEKTLGDVKIIPEHAAYRKAVEEITNERMAAVKASEDVYTIEVAIGAGQIEELIQHAKDELFLIPQYASWKFWELSPPLPNDDRFDHSVMTDADPEILGESGLKNLATKARVDAIARHVAIEDAQAEAAKAAAVAAAAPHSPPAVKA